MESVRCSGHDLQCYLKTGSKPGPNQGKSFYVCSQAKEKCQFVKHSDIEARACPKHSKEMVYLQAIQKSSNGKSYYYRCKGKINEEGNKSNWCGHYTPSTDNSASPFTQFSLPQSQQNSTTKYTSSQNGTNVSNNHSQHDKPIANISGTTTDSSVHNKKRMESKPVSQSAKLTVESSFKELARKAPIKPTDINKDAILSSSPMAYRSKVKESTEVIEVVSSDDDDDENVNLSAVRRERQELRVQLQKQKNVVRSVKMSCLPDKGKKLMEDIEKLQKNISQLDLFIQTTDQKQANNTASKPLGNTQTVFMVNQPGKPPLYQTITKPILPNPTNTKPVVLATKPGSNQTILVTQPPPPGSNHTILLSKPEQLPPHVLAQMYAANPQAMTLYGGRMTAARLREVTTVTKEALEKLHKQLESCPESTDELEDPKGLNVNLMTHQRQALAWLCWREGQNPAGGILADDMGLGKTLTSISLILKQRERRETGSKVEKSTWLNRDKQLEKLGKSVVKSNATLIVCPASLIHQWHKEIERRCQSDLLKVLVYHGPNRESNILKLADNDIVLTTYNIISIEVGIKKGESAENAIKDEEDEAKEEEGSRDKKLPNILRIAWERIILDEAHNIKNYKSKTSMSICKLRAGFRWALTGTPIQNDLLDMYSLLRFLRCTPFDEYKVWKKNVDNSKGTTRLNTIVRTILLRRTKQQTNKEGKPLVPLPSKKVETYTVELTSYERAIYDKFFATTKSTVQNFVKRHEEKEAGTWNSSSKSTLTEEFQDKLKLNDSKAGSSSGGVGLASQSDGKTNASQLLVLILRLRQCCCHLSLMKQQLEEESLDLEGIEEKDNIELTLEEQMQGLLLESDTSDSNSDSTVQTPSDKPDLKLMFQPSHFSSKLKAVIEKIKAIRQESKKGQPLKSVIVSQWTKMLDVIGYHLKTMGISYSVIQGNIAAKKRTELVEDFNTNPSGAEVMLVSLRAGGVGLNLIGGNHLFIVDIHWNPALEQQACDRIFRVGQTRDVFIHKYVCKDTIEEKIVDLQKTKTQLADNVLSGSGAATQKLSLNDLRMMFGV